MKSQGTKVVVPLGTRSYDILIRPGGVSEVGRHLTRLGFRGKVGVLTNPTVHRLYGTVVIRSLKKAGFQPLPIVIPDGERVKSLQWTSKILDQLIAHRFERGSVLVALGGGVIGDITGFAAAVYLRGIPFVQVPTTLVAQVDSSVGGKTGVNHPLGKNLIGAFYQPALVLSDTDTLKTLPTREWRAGLAEVIKYGMIWDAKFFAFLEKEVQAVLRLETEAVQYLVQRSCEIKAAVVAKDERESGLRRILNYGHTIGHALEAFGKYRKLIHGEAVGIGMVYEADLSRSLGYCAEEVVARQRALVRETGLPDRLPSIPFPDLWSAMLHDKKVANGKVHCILPKKIGQVDIVPLAAKSVRRWFQTHTGGRPWPGRAGKRSRPLGPRKPIL